ncbi:MAG: hypothetical protein ACPL0B_03080, partial [Anaerolineales bacterium]
AQAALSGASLNVRINLKDLEKTPAVTEMLSELNSLENQASQLQAQIKTALRERGGLGDA